MKSLASLATSLIARSIMNASSLRRHRIRPYLLSSDAAIRQLSHKIYRAATFGSRDLALLADDEAFDVPEGAQQTVFATFYVKNHKPWLQYFEASRSDRGIQVRAPAAHRIAQRASRLL
jgi:hypothetical protein